MDPIRQFQNIYRSLSRSSFRFLLFLLGAVLALTPGSIYAQTVWTHLTDQPVLDYGDAGQWDDYAIDEPGIIKDGDTLRMWYTGGDADPDYGGIWNIGYAWSLDGISWNRYVGNPVLSAELTWEGVHVGFGAVINDGDTLRMWYSASSAQWPMSIIGYATSVDGINWTKHLDPVLQVGSPGAWDSENMYATTVIQESGGYKMWYTGMVGSPWLIQTGLATSTDGIHWDKYDNPSTIGTLYSASDPVLKVGPAGSWEDQRVFGPVVLPTTTGYEIWYAGSTPDIIQMVGYATSTDGISWTKWPTNPVISTDPAWGYDYLPGSVLQFGGLYHLWYTSFNSSGYRPRIGYATSLPGFQELTVSPATYVTPGSDSVVVTAHFTGDTTGLGLFAQFELPDSTPLDSVHLYDDGTNFDETEGDSLFTNAWPVPATEEQTYLVGLQATLSDTEVIRYHDLARFTTIGPVGLHSSTTPFATEPIGPGSDVYFAISLSNDGSTTTATDVSAVVTPENDTLTTLLSGGDSFLTYGDITAGDTTNADYYSVHINENVPVNSDLRFYLSIASEGYPFWCDTFSVHINPLGIAENESALPTEFALRQNYPNPFNPVSTIEYSLPRASEVSLFVYDITGREVAKLVEDNMVAGNHQAQWNGQGFASGIYIARLVTPEYTKSIKMVLLK